MNSRVRQYLFASIFFAVGAYYAVKSDYVEGALYMLAGLAFAANSMVSEPRLAPYRKAVVIVSWTLIIATGILFLWVMQFKYF
jgi:hypothetical protein